MSRFVKLPDEHVVNAAHVVQVCASTNIIPPSNNVFFHVNVYFSNGSWHEIECKHDSEAERLKAYIDELLLETNGH
jgi:hypothetical protein